MQPILFYLKPWDFSPTVLLACTLPTAAYVRGLVIAKRAGEGDGFWRPFSYFLGIGLIYVMLQTYYDYLAQHMFFLHRLQHLVLHHIGPFLVAIAAPWSAMARGVPDRLRERVLRPIVANRPVQSLYAFLQNPVVAPFLFMGMVYFWLTPSIHFTAMLDINRYRAMNWGMVIDGILFWWLMVAPRNPLGHANISYMARILILFIVMVLQLVLGAYITLHKSVLFNVYGLCGRAWNIDPMMDQQLGGLITWIPPSMMSVVGILVVLRRIMHDPESPPLVSGMTETAAQ